MFEDSLVESSGTLSKRNPWTAALSFAMQGVLAGVLVLLPIIYTEALPGRQLTSILTEPSPPPGLAPVSTHARGVQPRPMPEDRVLRVPNWIPPRVAILHDQPASADAAGAPELDGIPGGTGTVPNSVISNVIKILPAMPKVFAPPKVRVSSGVAQGLLIHQTKPVYPPLAMQARIQGTVLLQAVVAKDGTVQDLHVVSGHPLLVKAALDAVKLWRYKPYRLNDQPVEVDTEIIVNFTLGSR
ncbi:MAG: TonB family protein [Candidatus Korobacteraceae bacterium]|jgi:protein TonB